jgi:hypothetical protein
MPSTTNLGLTKSRSKSKLGADFDAFADAVDTILGGLALGPNGGQLQIRQASELVTIAAAASSDSVANLLPANAIILGVTARVVVAIPTATTFSIGDATTVGRFAAGVAVAINTTAVSGFIHHNPADTNAAGAVQGASAAKIRITPNGTPATAVGRVRLHVTYMIEVAPTS